VHGHHDPAAGLGGRFQQPGRLEGVEVDHVGPHVLEVTGEVGGDGRIVVVVAVAVSIQGLVTIQRTAMPVESRLVQVSSAGRSPSQPAYTLTSWPRAFRP